MFLGTTPQSVLVKDGVFSEFLNKYLDSTYATNSSGKATIATVLYPHDATHAKANMSRITGSNYSGAFIDHGNFIVDVALAASSSGAVQYDGISFIGQSALYRIIDNTNSLLRPTGDFFNDGAFPAVDSLLQPISAFI